MECRLDNLGLEFVQGVVLRFTAGEVLDVRLKVARTFSPRRWQVPAFRMERLDGEIRVWMVRADNWARWVVEVIGVEMQSVSAGLIPLNEESEARVAARLRQSSIAFLGCARDCAEGLTRTVECVSRLRGLFGASSLHFFENDSVDGTRARIAALQASGLAKLHGFSGLDALMTRRTERLAFARNTLLEAALKEGAQYICWIDCDGLLDEEFEVAGFLSCFRWEAVWDGVFPVNPGYYYDIWALRHPVMWPSDYVERMNSEVDLALGMEQLIRCEMLSRQISANRMAGWLPVESAFGGMAIYRAEVCRHGRYVGLEDDHEVCEHVSFNRGIVGAGARLYVNPQFRVKCPDEHLARGLQVLGGEGNV
jgi:hypothetical protein